MKLSLFILLNDDAALQEIRNIVPCIALNYLLKLRYLLLSNREQLLDLFYSVLKRHVLTLSFYLFALKLKAFLFGERILALFGLQLILQSFQFHLHFSVVFA